MATENPLRFMGSTGAGQWSSSENAASFSFNDMEAEELGLLMKGYKIHEDQKDVAPNRSSSAPPNMEGSFAAVGNIMAQQNPGLSQSLASLSSSFENYESEEQLRADPAYFAYYCSNVNLNPRLPPPLLSRENRRLTRHSGGFGNNWRLTSFDDNINGPLHLTHGSLSTHEEELEEDKSSQKASDDWAVSSSMLLSPPGKSASSATRHKSSIDLMQGGFPHPPSPVCSQSRSSTYATTEESVDHDIEATALNDSSGGRSNLAKPNHGSGEVGVSADTLNADVVASISNNDAPDASFPSLSFSDGIGSLQAPQRGKPTNKDAGSENNALTGGATESNFSRMESRMRALNASSLLGDNGRNKQEQSYDRIIPQRHPNQQETATMYKVQGVQTQLISQGLNSSYGGIDKLSHFLPKVPSVEAQQVPPELTPPLYATAAAYMTAGSPFYPNLHASGLFAPQFNMSGYALGSTLFPPFMAGYPSQNPIPMPFDASSTHSFNGRTAGVSTGERIPHGGDYPYLNKIYGQHGLMLQPSFIDPHHMQYFQPSLEVGYSASGQYGRLTSRSDAGGQIGSFVLQKDSPYRNGPNLQSPSSGSLSNPSPRKGVTKGSSYYGSPPSLGVATQFPAPALASPVLPGSPVGGSSHPEQRHEMRFPQGSVRNTGVYAGRQGQRRGESFDDPKKHTFLEELKANNARKFELSDIAGRIVEFSVDQYGSRFIQQKLENCGAEDKASVFKEVLPHASKLMTDVFGNYVIQKFFEHGSHEQRKELANQLSGQMLSLSLQMCGCRVIQKALEVIELDQKTQLVHELDGHVMRCVRDQNGNHVIQKCIECVPTEKIGFIIDAFRGHVATLSTHPYGCRVIQRVLEHCSDQLQSQCIVDEILESACVLAQDQYGNYVTQHVLDRGRPYERSCIISKLSGKIVQMSQHKYASNVVEKCLEHGDASERELLIQEIIGQSEENDNLLIMMKDQFANYVVQKILETSNDKQREVLLKRVRGHLNALKKYTYGKHIVARFEQIYGEETEASDHP